MIKNTRQSQRWSSFLGSSKSNQSETETKKCKNLACKIPQRTNRTNRTVLYLHKLIKHGNSYSWASSEHQRNMRSKQKHFKTYSQRRDELWSRGRPLGRDSCALETLLVVNSFSSRVATPPGEYYEYRGLGGRRGVRRWWADEGTQKKNAFVFWNENEISMLAQKFSTSCLDFSEKGKRVRGRKRELKS